MSELEKSGSEAGVPAGARAPDETACPAIGTAVSGGLVDFGPAGKIWIAVFFAALVFLALSLCHTITTPWVEDDNWYGAVYSQAAHNNLRAGLAATGGVPVTLYFGPLPFPADAFYVHHPTLLPLAVTGAFAIFGEAEWVARLLPIACSLLSVVLLWLLVRSALGRRAATLCAAVFATLPMELHYGDMVDFEPCLVMLMLAALLCLRHLHVNGRARWAVLAVAACFLAVSMDWPGYLFVLSLTGYFLLRWWKKSAQASRPTPAHSLGFALSLLGVSGLSGIFFLFQIRYARADAWSDLWNALMMRLSSSAATDAQSAAVTTAHFTFMEWCGAIARGLSADFLPLPWFFVAAGIVVIWTGRRKSEGLRWCGFAMMPMTIAGVLYVVILRNESFDHDFATFYLIGALALAGGIGVEGLLVAFERKFPRPPARALAAVAVIACFAWLGASAFSRSESLRSPFSVLDAEKPEPPDLIPSLGRILGRKFPAGTTILCNFAASGTLDYYAQRPVMNGITLPSDWKIFASAERPPLGGIIWLDAPDASDLLASLKREELSEMTFKGFRFALWRSAR